ncbi:hypothetical protein V9T40_001478 [Parthenolecanium corni]|uniref:MATH domain-containing protein n=1 Tax=Parthenolecanium corni TaxID=536013 RepID=A0AAN9TI06_9HEMI
MLARYKCDAHDFPEGKMVKFTSESAAQGNRNYISVNDLYARNFTDANGEFQLELCIGTVRTLFDSEFRIPTSFLGHHIGHRGLHHHGGIATSTLTNIKTPAGTVTKVETSYFSFAGFDWNIALYPHGIKEAHGSNETRLAIYLNRCTGFDHQCRVKYNITLGDTEHTIKSGIMEDVSDSEGKSYGWHPRGKYTDLIRKGVIKIHAELILANTLSELVSNVTFQSVPATIGGSANVNHGVSASAVVSQCYDRDKQGWTVKCDCHAESIRIHMVYKDVQNVPRNHLR